MKKFIILIAFLALGVSAHADCRIDTIYKYKFAPGSSEKKLTDRFIYTYNAQNLETEWVHQLWNNFNYINFTKINTSYYPSQLIQTQTIMHWNSTTNDWENSNKTDFSYNTAGKVLSEQIRHWETAIADWRLQSQLNYTYNATNKVEELNSWVYDIGTAGLINNYRKNYVYDAGQNLIEEIRRGYDMNTNSLENQIKITNTYNTSNDNVETIRHLWDDGVGWEYSDKLTSTYNSTHGLTESIVYQFVSLSWLPISKTNTDYYSFNKPSNTVVQNWNFASSTWTDYNRTLYLYNAAEQITERKNENYSYMFAAWINARNDTYEYNPDGCLKAFDLYSNWESAGFYDSHLRQEYYTTGIPTSIAEPDAPGTMKIYPNPVKDGILYIDCKIAAQPCRLYDFSGKLLQSQLLQNGINTIDVTKLATGIYFIKTGNEAKKIIIQ